MPVVPVSTAQALSNRRAYVCVRVRGIEEPHRAVCVCVSGLGKGQPIEKMNEIFAADKTN